MAKQLSTIVPSQAKVGVLIIILTLEIVLLNLFEPNIVLAQLMCMLMFYKAPVTGVTVSTGPVFGLDRKVSNKYPFEHAGTTEIFPTE